MIKLTAEILEKHGACEDGVRLFRALFPHGTFCTKRDVEKWKSRGCMPLTSSSWAYRRVLGFDASNRTFNICQYPYEFAKAWRKHAHHNIV